uniref:Telomerase RNA component interacting RNase n=1 Tax=Cyprinus carpio TaxID=7962 RepID=A0A8C1WMZ8_CYPCA
MKDAGNIYDVYFLLRSSSSTSSSSSGESGGSSPAHGAPKAANAFANDGSFMELFKKKMEEEERRKRETEEEEDKTKSSAAPPDKKPISASSFVGKRRGGARLALKTGMVAKKQKLDSEAEAGKGDAWTTYMAEVKKYKAHQCGDDDKTRPLVK